MLNNESDVEFENSYCFSCCHHASPIKDSVAGARHYINTYSNDYLRLIKDMGWYNVSPSFIAGYMKALYHINLMIKDGLRHRNT